MTLPWARIPSLNSLVAGCVVHRCFLFCITCVGVSLRMVPLSQSLCASILWRKSCPTHSFPCKKSFLWLLLSFFLSPLLLTLSYNVWKVYGNWEHKFQVKVMPLTILLHIWLASYTCISPKFALPFLLLFHHHITDTNGRRCGRTSRRWTSFPSSYKAPA